MSKNSNRIKFSDTTLHRLALQKEGVRDYRDLRETGLILRVGKKSKTFYAHVSTGNGNRGMRKLGPFSMSDDGLSYEEARQKFLHVKSSQAGEHTGFGKITLETYLDEGYKADRSGRGDPVSDKSIADIKHYYAHALHKKCKDLSDADIEKFLENFSHLADPTKRKGYYYFHALIRTLEFYNRIPDVKIRKRSFNNNPNTVINTFKIDRQKVYDFLFEPELGKDHKFSRGFNFETRLIMALGVDTGARPGEIIKNWKDNFILDDEPEMRIPAVIAKNGEPREVPINSDFLVEKLKLYVEKYWTPNPGGLMFYNRSTGKSYSSQCYRAIWERVKEEFELKGRYYELRHTFGTDVYEITGDIKMTADLMGNSVLTASRSYVKKTKSARERLRGKL
ncbi:tyrosine-type recombinase/integrase [Marinobacter salarius]|uniref:tyrosine-type recombinase/integrase n=1 Tax=Marinobacter salarius TaxID=1420917 RepID=UPI003BACE163